MDKKLLGLMLIFFLSFTLFTSIIIFQKPLQKITRAKEDYLPSAKNSLIFAWPLTLKADGKSQTEVTVFVRSKTNKPVSNKPVGLTTSLGKIKPAKAFTSKEGKATFHIFSNTPGIAEVSAVVDNSVKILQKVTIKFEPS